MNISACLTLARYGDRWHFAPHGAHCVLFHTRNIALELRERAFCCEFLVRFDQVCTRLF